MYISINQCINTAVMFVSRSHLCIDHWTCLLDILQRHDIFTCPTNHWTCLLQRPGMFTCPTKHWTCLLHRQDMFTCLTNHWTCLLQRQDMFTFLTNNWACLLQRHDRFTCRSTIVLTATTIICMIWLKYQPLLIFILLIFGKHLHDRTISLREEDWTHKTSLASPRLI